MQNRNINFSVWFKYYLNNQGVLNSYLWFFHFCSVSFSFFKYIEKIILKTLWHLKLALGQGGSFFYHFRKIRIDSHRLILDLLRHIGIALVDADVKSIPPVIGILPEIVFDDAGGVVAGHRVREIQRFVPCDLP